MNTTKKVTGPPIEPQTQQLFRAHWGEDRSDAVVGIMALKDGIHVTYRSGLKIRFVPEIQPGNRVN